MALTVLTPIQMRFADVDQFGHINNIALQEYFDLGKSDLFAELWRRSKALERVPAIVVKLQTEFLKQLYYGDDLQVQTTLAAIGNKSLTLRQRILRGQEECCRSEVVMVCFNRQQNQAIEVPDQWREFLSDESEDR